MDSMISEGGYNIVFNMLSMGIAAMLFTTIFLVMAKDRVLPRYRMAVMVSGTVTAIAAYHYFRMFDSFNRAVLVCTDNNKTWRNFLNCLMVQ